MANYDEEQKKGESGLDRAGEEAKRYAGDRAKEKLSGKGAKEGAKETGKDTAKQAAKETGKKVAKEGPKKASMAAGPEAYAAVEAADQVQEAVRHPEEAVKKTGVTIGAIIAIVNAPIIAAVLIVVVVAVTFLALIFGQIEIGEAAPDEPSSVLSITKTANPAQFPNGAEGVGQVFKEVTYTVVITNTGADPVKDIVISDDCGGAGGELVDSLTPPGEIAAGATETITYKCKIRTDPPAYNDRYHINTITVNGSIETTTGGNGTSNLDYYIPFRNETVKVINESQVKSQVTNNPNWPDNFVNTECESGVSCWDYVKKVAVTGGVNPVFVLAVWIAESGASHYSGHLSCPNGGIGLSRTVADLKLSVDCFVDLANNFSSGQFVDMIDQFCDPATPEICQEPPAPVKTFLSSLKSWYETLVPQGNPGAMTTINSPPTQISSSATARVKIGNPPIGPPEYSPFKGIIDCSGGYDFWPTFNPATSPCIGSNNPHNGMDIVSTNIDIFSPFSGSARVSLIRDDDNGDCFNPKTPCAGYYIELVSGDTDEFRVRLLHLKRGSKPAEIQEGVIVETDQKLAEMGNTGTSSGPHLHYEIYVDGVAVDPKDYNVFTPHP